MDESIIAILCIALFVVYPFAMACLAHRLSRGLRNHRFRDRFMPVAAGIGAIPAALMILGIASAKIPSVNIVAAIVLVLCFAATGAAVGAARDRRHSENRFADTEKE